MLRGIEEILKDGLVVLTECASVEIIQLCIGNAKFGPSVGSPNIGKAETAGRDALIGYDASDVIIDLELHVNTRNMLMVWSCLMSNQRSTYQPHGAYHGDYPYWSVEGSRL